MFKRKFLSLVTVSFEFLSNVYEYYFFRFPLSSLVAVLVFEFLSNVYEYYFLDFRLLNFISAQMVEGNALLCLIQTSAWTFTLGLHVAYSLKARAKLVRSVRCKKLLK